MLTAFALVVAGAVWMLAIALFNIGVQLSAPRWVAGRALAAFQASIAGGVALGSWAWGNVANSVGVGETLLISGGRDVRLAADRPLAANAAGGHGGR